MNPFDIDGLTDMLGGFQKRLDEIKSEAAKTEVMGEAGGGAVQVVATGENRIVSVKVSEAAMEDRELLEDLFRAAANEALRKAQAASAGKLSELASAIPLPPGLRP